MPETTGASRDEHRHSGLMAGLEIVDADEAEDGTPQETEPEPEPIPEQPPAPDPTVEHALAPIQKMWDGTETRSAPPAPAAAAPVEKPPRRLFLALPGLLVLAIVAAFASWVTAAPLWLTLGAGVEGTVTVKTCDAAGCRGVFVPEGEDHSIAGVRVTGDDRAKQAGASHTARITSADAGTAYVGGPGGLWWRVGAGLAVLIGCGFAVAAITGAWRWHGRARALAVSTSLAAPLALFLVVFAVSW